MNKESITHDCISSDCPNNAALCHFRFDQLDEKLDKALMNIDKLNTKLFIGNGTPALTNRIDLIEQSIDAIQEDRKTTIKRVGGALAALGVGVLGVLLPPLVRFIGKVIQ